ncbi:hypothetical protein HBI50_125560 [Parastagonospora nodorum]|nr:hypothetical protein HBI50_125560 [Parastagonospora nodorum]
MCFTSPIYVDTFSLDFAFLFANILLLIAFIISYRLFADKLRLTPSTLLAKFILTTKIRDPFLKTLKNAAKSRILLTCKHYNFNIYISLATNTLHLLLKGLVIKMLDFMQDILDNIYPSTIIFLLFVSKAPFALHFIRASYDEDTLAYIQEALERMNRTLEEEKNFNYPKALNSICTKANSKAYYITILILGIQPYLTKLPLSKVAANIAISNFIYAAAVFLYLILIIIDYTCYNKDRKHIAYIRAFSKVLLFNNNRQINNTTRILSIPFKFYNLSTIIRLVHLILRDLPNLTTYTTISYYVNNYIN